MYAKCLKRIIDFALSFIAIIVLSPILLILILVGAIAMGGNPFFIQPRLGKKGQDGKEKIFHLIKFRTMSNKRDKNGDLLPDDQRLNKYGRILRATSLDELPELWNILSGNMSIVGPRPLLVSYLPFYTDVERQRHNVRPGLTGLAQVNGRSFISWEEIFSYDLEYVQNLSFANDIKILINTVKKVLNSDNVADATQFIQDENGKLYVIVDGEKKEVHRALDIERSQSETEGK